MTQRYGYTRYLSDRLRNGRQVLEYEIIDAFESLDRNAEQEGHDLDWDTCRLVLGKDEEGRYLRVSITQQAGDDNG